MKLRHLGYAAKNLTLDTTTGRTLRLANLTPERVTEVTKQNLDDLWAMLRWNVERDIFMFRIGSSIVPFASHPDFPLEWREVFAGELAALGSFVQKHDLRLSMHPGQYTVLNSPNEEVVTRAVAELDYHAAFLESIDPAQGTMTLHVGGAYGDREKALALFVQNFARLSPAAQRRLILENDDKTFVVEEVLEVCKRLGIPAVFDFFHHKCNHRAACFDEGLQETLAQVVATWGERVPKFHLSSPRDPGKTAHADFIDPADFEEMLGLMNGVDGDAPYDVMLEAKAKERALLEVREGLEGRTGEKITKDSVHK